MMDPRDEEEFFQKMMFQISLCILILLALAYLNYLGFAK